MYKINLSKGFLSNDIRDAGEQDALANYAEIHLYNLFKGEVLVQTRKEMCFMRMIRISSSSESGI